MLARPCASRCRARRDRATAAAGGEHRADQHHHERGRDSRGGCDPVISHVNRVLVESSTLRAHTVIAAQQLAEPILETHWSSSSPGLAARARATAGATLQPWLHATRGGG